MKSSPWLIGFVMGGLVVAGCGTTSNMRDLPKPADFMQRDERIAIVPFEVQEVLSNLGAQLSDEVTINILKHAPDLQIAPANQVKSFLQAVGLVATGLPDEHTIHKVKEGLKCKYMLTGNLYTSLGDVRYTQTYTTRLASGSITIRLTNCDTEQVVWAKREESSATTVAYYTEGQQQPSYTFETDGQLIQRLIVRLGQYVAQNFYEHEYGPRMLRPSRAFQNGSLEDENGHNWFCYWTTHSAFLAARRIKSFSNDTYEVDLGRETFGTDVRGVRSVECKEDGIMKWQKLVVAGMVLCAFEEDLLAQHHHGSSSTSTRKDPAIAAVLSIQPLPLDLGGFYAGNWERGVIYSAAEIALFVPAMVLIAENSNWGHHRSYRYYYDDYDRKTWTSAERERFYYLVGGYVLVKIVSAFDAGYSVERKNRSFSLRFDPQSKSLSLGMDIAIP